jgi:DNA adenine methylase
MIKSQRPKVKIHLRPPVSYWGGRQLLLPKILPIIPQHEKYVEPFVGGGAVYWSKEPSKIEVINDLDGFVGNFYDVCKQRYNSLEKLIKSSKFSRLNHDQACIIRQHPELFGRVKRAWSFYFLANTSMFSILGNPMNMSNTSSKPVTIFNNKVNRFTDDFENRLKNTFIESRDALYVLTRHDSSDAFHFIDPPYYNADMGHYAGYSLDDFKALLDVCAKLEGKFLLTCYPSDTIDEYAQKYNWIVEQHDMQLSAGAKGKRKTEVFVRNYTL